MDTKRIFSYRKKSDKEIEARIRVCRKELSNAVNQQLRQELVEEIRFLKEILNDRRNTKEKKVNRVKNAPTIAERRDRKVDVGNFRDNKVYL